jgi:hypothetical protein
LKADAADRITSMITIQIDDKTIDFTRVDNVDLPLNITFLYSHEDKALFFDKRMSLDERDRAIQRLFASLRKEIWR